MPQALVAQRQEAPDLESGQCGFESLREYVITLYSSAEERLPYKQRVRGSNPREGTVVEIRKVSGQAVNLLGEGAIPSDHPT